MTRRTWNMLKTVLATFVIAPGLSAQGPTNVPPIDNVIREQVTGEPYRLYGNRIVFTNWQYVAPGSFNWLDEQGNGVAANRQVNIGDWGAHLITSDTPRGIRIVAQPAERRGDVIPLERPWEERGVSVKTLIQDGPTYKLWASCVDGAGQNNPCYFESTDGLHWTRPNLGLVEYQGSREPIYCPAFRRRASSLIRQLPPPSGTRASLLFRSAVKSTKSSRSNGLTTGNHEPIGAMWVPIISTHFTDVFQRTGFTGRSSLTSSTSSMPIHRTFVRMTRS